MQELEIVVSVKNWDEAVQLLEDVGIDEKTKTTHRPINGLFMVKAEKEVPFTEDEYKKIKDSPDMAILGDSLSRKRIAEVLDKIYDVETLLRKLLLHSYDLFDTFFDVFSESKYTKEFRSNKFVTRKGSLNPITSHLTLGEMKDILGVDLSWHKRKMVSAQELHELLQTVDDIDGLKSEFANKVKVHTVWDVIAENVLKTKTEWNDVNNELKGLKEFRDMSAHYQVITERDKEKLIERADHLLALLSPPERKLTKKESTNLSNAAKSLNELIKQIKPITFPADYYQDLIARSMPDVSAFRAIGTPAQDALAKVFKQQQSVDFSALFNAQKSAFESFNSIGIQDGEEDDDEDDNSSDDNDQDSDTAVVPR